MSVDTQWNMSPVLGTGDNDGVRGTGRSEVLAGYGGDDQIIALSGGDEVFDLPHSNWSILKVSRMRTENGCKASQTRRDCLEVTPGRCAGWAWNGSCWCDPASMTDRHPIIGDLADPSMLIRARSCDVLDISDCQQIYCTLDPSEVDLGFAGRLADGNQSLAALERLSAGDSVNLEHDGDRWLIQDNDGVVIGRLAKKFTPPEAAEFVKGSVFAITERYRTDSADEYQHLINREQWPVVLPELVFRKSA